MNPHTQPMTIETEAEHAEPHQQEDEMLRNATLAATYTKDKIDDIIELAERSEKLIAAYQKIRKAVLQMALPGDWIRFGTQGKEGTLSLSGAGAERIAAIFGISHVNFTMRKEVEPDGHYTYVCTCTALMGSRRLEGVTGYASTKEKFYLLAGGEEKEISDISEVNIRQAARHTCIKNATREILGLRSLPEGDAESLGLNPRVVRGYEFKDRSGRAATTVSAPQAAASATGAAPARVDKLGTKQAGNATVQVVTINGVPYETFKAELVAGIVVGDYVEFTSTPNKNPRYAARLETIKKVAPPAPAPDAREKKDIPFGPGVEQAPATAPTTATATGKNEQQLRIAEVTKIQRGSFTIGRVVGEEGDAYETFKTELLDGYGEGEDVIVTWEPPKKPQYPPTLTAIRRVQPA